MLYFALLAVALALQFCGQTGQKSVGMALSDQA